MLQGIYTSLSALNTNQKALDVTSHNLANQNTEGYTKQRVNFSTNPIKDTANTSADIKMGTGTHVQSVERVEDPNLFNELLKANKNNQSNREMTSTINSLDNTLQNESFSNMYDIMFKNLHRYAEMPHNIKLQHLVEESAKNLKKRSQQIMEVFNNEKNKNTEIIKQREQEIPILKKNIEDLNNKIKEQEALNPYSIDKTYANDLRDRKDILTSQLTNKEGSIDGLQKSNKIIEKYQVAFKDSFDSTYKNVDNYLKSNQTGEDANRLIEKEDNIRNDHKKFFVELKSDRQNFNVALGSSEAIMNAFQNKDDNISKVNPDEEMVNMMKYQRSYEANAKVIQTMDEILKTTIELKK